MTNLQQQGTSLMKRWRQGAWFPILRHQGAWFPILRHQGAWFPILQNQRAWYPSLQHQGVWYRSLHFHAGHGSRLGPGYGRHFQSETAGSKLFQPVACTAWSDNPRTTVAVNINFPTGYPSRTNCTCVEIVPTIHCINLGGFDCPSKKWICLRTTYVGYFDVLTLAWKSRTPNPPKKRGHRPPKF